MDPNLFHLDWERTFEALTMIIVLAFFVERALAVVFENRIFIERFDRAGVKELIALALSVWVCYAWKFDAISICILTDTVTVPGFFLTGAVIAGGSKASIKLFHDVMQAKSTTYDRRHEIQAENAAEVAENAAAEAQDKKDLVAIARPKRAAESAVVTATRAAQAGGSKAAAESLERAKAALVTIEAVEKKLQRP